MTISEWLELIKEWDWLLGIIIGALLTGVGSLLGGWITTKRVKGAIQDELRANRYQIEQKRDIVRQAREALNRGNVLPTFSLPISTTVFDSHFPAVVTL